MWEHHRILFEDSDLKRELGIAPIFFSDLRALFVRNLVLEVCKIADPARTGGRTNLTVKFLIEHSDFSSTPATLDRLKRLSDSIHAFRDKIVPARNRLIAHLDRESQFGQPLGGAPQEDWLQFWFDLQDFLNIIYKHYVDPNGFYLNGVSQPSDAHMLVMALKDSTYF
jgi:hypothetical protein